MAVRASDFRIEEAETGKSWGFHDQSALGSGETLKTSNRAGHLLSVRFCSIGTHAFEGTRTKTHAHTVKVVLVYFISLENINRAWVLFNSVDLCMVPPHLNVVTP